MVFINPFSQHRASGPRDTGGNGGALVSRGLAPRTARASNYSNKCLGPGHSGVHPRSWICVSENASYRKLSFRLEAFSKGSWIETTSPFVKDIWPVPKTFLFVT